MIAGAAVMLASLALVKAAPQLWKKISAGYASPESAGAYGDAY